MTEIETGVFYDPSKQYLHEQSGELQNLPFQLATWQEVDALNMRPLTRHYTNFAGTHKLVISFSYTHELPHPAWGAIANILIHLENL